MKINQIRGVFNYKRHRITLRTEASLSVVSASNPSGVRKSEREQQEKAGGFTELISSLSNG